MLLSPTNFDAFAMACNPLIFLSYRQFLFIHLQIARLTCYEIYKKSQCRKGLTEIFTFGLQYSWDGDEVGEIRLRRPAKDAGGVEAGVKK